MYVILQLRKEEEYPDQEDIMYPDQEDIIYKIEKLLLWTLYQEMFLVLSSTLSS